jgi:hypothetical protein
MEKGVMQTKNPFKKASWMWPKFPNQEELNEPYLRNCYAQFRYDFKTDIELKKAPLFITADQFYVLYINGCYAGRGPARGYQISWPYDEIDIKSYLRKGRNWISIVAYNAGESNFGYRHENAAGVLCSANWGEIVIHSGMEWQMRCSPAHEVNTARLSIQLNFQEHFDARLDDEKWIYSSEKPDDWPKPTGGCIRPYGVMPWHGLEPRGIPNLTTDIIAYKRVFNGAIGKCGQDYKNWQNLTLGFYEENKKLKWRPVSVGSNGKGSLNFDIPTAGRGQTAAVSVDMDVPSVGTLIVEINGGKAGDVIDFFFCELIDMDNGPVMISPLKICGVSMSSRLVLRQDKTQHEFFQIIGHRYLVVIARETTSDIHVKVALRQTIYPIKIKGSFNCDQPLYNDIYNICLQTQRICALDSYVDTPWREQAQWWGDARVQSQNMFHISGDTRLLERGIRSIARQEVPNGLTYGHAPTMSHKGILPDFSLIWILTIWDYYNQTGNISLFVEQWPRIKRLLEYFTSEAIGRHGLLEYDPRYWLFLDWCNIHKHGVPTLLNFWYLLALNKLAIMADIADMCQQANQFRKMENSLRRKIENMLWDCGEGLFCDGLDSRGRQVKYYSIHNQTLAILCALKPAYIKSMVTKRLLPYLGDVQMIGAIPSSYWVTYVYDVMVSLGYGKQVCEHICRHWSPMIPYGGTWETFNIKFGTESISHAWSAHPIYHFVRTLGGVRQNDIGWKKIIFSPVFDVPGINSVEITVPTPLGPINSVWRHTASHINVLLNMPKGMKAKVMLPGNNTAIVELIHRWKLLYNS